MAQAGYDRNEAAGNGASPEPAERDLVALGILVASIFLFIGTGSTVLTGIVRSWITGVGSPDLLLGNALILNIALLILGWRRYAEMQGELAARREAEDTATRLARTDALTGCLNRRSLDEAIAGMVESAGRDGDELAILMVDLDKFKRSNDLLGHKAGDAVLIETAQRLSALLPPRALVARLGGDEFICAAVFPPCSEAAIERLAMAVNGSLAQPIKVGALRAEVTASIGVAVGSRSAVHSAAQVAQDLLHRADLAMYQAKRRGRNRFAWFVASMERELRQRSELEQSIREGLPRGEFVPYYEKQVDLETGEITGFEMLARWISPQHGVVGPDLFIPVAEEIGLIGELSEALIARALEDARDWDPRLTLSVNISPLQLRDPWFAQRLLKLLVTARFPPARLEVEVTETCLHENIGVVRSLITSLKNQGIRISLDDFGTGYSSLAQLRTLPFDRIKIDRSFVSSLGQNADSASIVEAISSLGRGMSLPITAEGIETPEVLAALRGFGQFKGQGYLYGKPASAADVRRELAEQGLLSKVNEDAAPPQLPDARRA
ncbi:EAL domain-containing protein [Novosphingobium sp. PASSN1]|uniref:putative bifunctional diguanylate cyclase/phosphodiesterase n=1 Tax=Novosphingobium sp. PASSN1 TaxID=2015561 RepID=UPI000BC649F6|nr:EAL domain-containing protein [Novosphingobium sp. PASSN1]OYU34883.1 MAG: GGDEF-domain containing protein [Novosphingobium sp. PASSN1]